MNILGISCFYHDSAACVVKDGKVVSAAQEERFNREKNSSDFPIQSINACLQAADLTTYDLDYVGFYEKPFLKFQRVILSHLKSYPFSIKNFLRVMPHWLDDRLIIPLILKKELGYEGKVLFVKHHLAHAASAFFASPFQEASIITSDGVGEWATTTVGEGKNNEIRIFKELHYPNSLGLLYSAITTYLGFEANRGEGKVMALADYGKPTYLNKLKEVVITQPDGSFKIDPGYFGFNEGSKMYSNKFIKMFGKPRLPKTEIEERHFDIAASLQKLVEEILVQIAKCAYKKDADNLCLAGGTFLNCVANSKILEETKFKRIFIQPAAGDSGGAMGIALYIHHSLLKNPRAYTMTNASLGPKFSSTQIRRCLLNNKANFKEFEKSSNLISHVAKEISQDKIVGWFQGGMEWGPRALGHRSILANPCNPNMKRILNEKVKHREWFRPYGIAILKKKLNKFFDLNVESPFMLLVGKVKESKKGLIPSAVHANGTSRIQTVTKEDNNIFYDLVEEFNRITNIPMIINTSFNDNNEPIVCTPEDAYSCFMKTKIDCLVLGDFFIEKDEVKNEVNK